MTHRSATNRVVILDGYTVNPGDISWNPLHTIAHLTIYNRTSPGQIIERIHNNEIVLTTKTMLTSEVIANAPALKYIGIMSTGTNVVDLGAARSRNIWVTNAPNYCTESAADHTMALLLDLYRKVSLHSLGVSRGEWSASSDFCYWKSTPYELRDKTLGIIGLGAIGKAVAKRAAVFGMKIIHSSIRNPSCSGSVALPTLLRTADVVTIHVPLTEATTHLISWRQLAGMKKSAFLINISRGNIVDEEALLHSLREGDIAGAGLDVLSTEPPPPDHPLLTAPNCIITPHIAWASRDARQRLIEITADNLTHYWQGEMHNRIDLSN